MAKSKLFISVLLVISCFCFSSCGGDDLIENLPDDFYQNKEEAFDYIQSNCPVYFSPTLGETILTDALKETFTNQVSINDAIIAFITSGTPVSEFQEFYDRGGFLIITGNSDTDGQLMLNGYCNADITYSMPWPARPAPKLNVGSNVSASNTGVTTQVAGDPDDPNSTKEVKPYNAETYDANYIRRSLDDLVNWIYKRSFERTHDGNYSSSSEGASLDLNLASQVNHFVKSFRIDGFIDKAASSDPDYLTKASEIVGDISVIPVYASSANSADVAGDYYLVNLAVTIKNGKMWGPEQHKHGGCNLRIIGFYLKQLQIRAYLCDESFKPLPDVRFKSIDGSPEPESNIGSSTYTESKEIGFNIGLSAGATSSKDPSQTIGGNIGFSACWNSEISRSLQDLQVTLNTPNNDVEYTLDVMNIVNERNWDNTTTAISTHYPEICRSDLRFKCSWVWFLPKSGNATKGVDDGSTTGFKTMIYLRPMYEAFKWWRGALTSETKQFFPTDIYGFSEDPNCVQILLPVPDRTRFGFINLTNMSNKYTLSNIQISKAQMNDFKQVEGAITYNEKINIPVEEGKYDLIYSFINPNNNEEGLTYIIKNINVIQGRDRSESTRSVASTNGVLVE